MSYNFCYISQKYFIFRLITDVSESICETSEHYINLIIKDFLKNNNPDDFKNIYYQKFEDFEQKINEYRKNAKIYNEKNENNINTNLTKRISNEEQRNINRVQSKLSEKAAPSPGFPTS